MIQTITIFLINRFVNSETIGIVLKAVYKAYMDKSISSDTSIKEAEKVFIGAFISVLNYHRLLIGHGKHLDENIIKQLMEE